MATKKVTNEKISHGVSGGNWYIKCVNEKGEIIYRKLEATIEKEAMSEAKNRLPKDFRDKVISIHCVLSLTYIYETPLQIEVRVTRRKTPKIPATSKVLGQNREELVLEKTGLDADDIDA